MTQIISLLPLYFTTNLQQYSSRFHQNCLSACKTLLNSQDIFTVLTPQNQILFQMPPSLTDQQAFGSNCADFVNFGKISLETNYLSVMFELHDGFGRKIRAKSMYQRVAVLKLVMLLNQKLGSFVFKINPISGEIVMESDYLLDGASVCQFQGQMKIMEAIRSILQQYKKQYCYWRYILEYLEYVQCDYSTVLAEKQCIFRKYTNNLICYYCKKIQPVLELVHNRLPNHQPKASNPQKRELTQYYHHRKYFCSPITFPETPHISLNLTKIQTQKKPLIQQQISYLKLDSMKMRCSNYSYLQLEKNDPSIKKIQEFVGGPLQHIPHKFQEIFKIRDKSFKMCFRHLPYQDIKYEYSIVQKISRKKYFYTFIKEYAVLANYDTINKYFLITKAESGSNSTLSLSQYLSSNRHTLTFQTKLRLILQFVCVAIICLSDFQTSSPSLDISNIEITQKSMIRLVMLTSKRSNIQSDIGNTICKILFDKSFKDTRKIRYLKQQQYGLSGPSIMINLFLKLILEIPAEHPNSQKKLQQKPSLKDKTTSFLLLQTILSNLIILTGRMIDMIEHSHRFEAKMWLGLLN